MTELTKDKFQPFTTEEVESINLIPQYSFIQRFWRNLKSNPVYLISFIILFLIILAVLLADLYPSDPNFGDVTKMFEEPTAVFPLGTDELGRDYLARTLHGGRVSLIVGLGSAILGTLAGILIGVVAGYFGGFIDTFFMRFIDIFMSIPSIIIIVIINIYIRPTTFTLILLIALFSWMGVARIVRAQTMSLKQREYVEAAENLGASPIRIIFSHILPNTASEIVVAGTITVARAIILESTLSYLGYGISIPQASWGTMLQNAQLHALNYPRLSIVPGVLILLVVLSLNILGDVIRKSVDSE